MQSLLRSGTEPLLRKTAEIRKRREWDQARWRSSKGSEQVTGGQRLDHSRRKGLKTSIKSGVKRRTKGAVM